MKNELSCEIIMDLLPLYVDGLTSSATNKSIEEHIKYCPKCKKALEAMNKDIPILENSDKVEFDYLKKIKTNTRRKVFLAISLLLILFSLKTFVIGEDAVAEEVEIENLVVDSNNIAISVNTYNYNKAISKVNFLESDNIVDINLRSVRNSFIHDQRFYTSYTADENIEQVRIGNRIVWDKGVYISPITSKIYESRNPYIGNPSANAKLINNLRLENTLGNFKNQLKTDKRPYGWKIIIENDLGHLDRDYLNELFKSYSTVLIACVENLDYMDFEYSYKGNSQNFIWSIGNSNQELDIDIKSVYNSPAELQKLINNLKLPNL